MNNFHFALRRQSLYTSVWTFVREHEILLTVQYSIEVPIYVNQSHEMSRVIGVSFSVHAVIFQPLYVGNNE